MSNEDAIRDLLPGYALGCLDPEDDHAVRTHLPGCAACRGELESYTLVTDQLSTTAPAVEPPAVIERRIMRALGAARLTRTRAWRPALSAMAALFVAALVAGNLLQWTGVIQRSRPAAAAGLLTATLAGMGDARGAYGTMVLDPGYREGVLAVIGMPRLDGAHQYQLWLIRGSERRSAGVFGVDAEGYGSLLLTVPADFRGFRSIGVSVEPSGGSAAPTSARVMAGSL